MKCKDNLINNYLKWVIEIKEIYERYSYIIDIVSKILIPLSTLILSIWALTISNNQLKMSEMQYRPIIKVDVLVEGIDNKYETYIKVTNNGYPIKANIQTDAVMVTKMLTKDGEQIFNVKLDKFFSTENDTIENGNSQTGVICKRGTNFSSEYLDGAMYSTRQKLNDNFTSEKVQVYYDKVYYAKILYKDNYNLEQAKYYRVGRFSNQEISAQEYKNELNTDYTVDIGNYLNNDIKDNLSKIFMEKYTNK